MYLVSGAGTGVATVTGTATGTGTTISVTLPRAALWLVRVLYCTSIA